MFRKNAIALWFPVLVWCSSPCLAERIPPGTYSGFYHFDRWGQHRFAFLFVSPDLDKKLKPFADVHVSVEATKVDQPVNPGGAMIAAVGNVKRLPMPVRLTIEWKESKPGESTSIRRIKEGESIALQATMTNLSEEPLDFGSFDLVLNLAYHLPPSPCCHDSFHPYTREPARKLTISHFSGNLLPESQTVDVGRMHAVFPAQHLPGEPKLAKGKSRTWIITLDEIPPREYEVFVDWQQDRRKEQRQDRVRSNVLRLDVLTEKHELLQDLKVDLVPEERSDGMQSESRECRVEFTNTGKRTLRLGLKKAGSVYDFIDDLLCYDADGQRLLLPELKGDVLWDLRRVEPGKSTSVTARIPAGTDLARIVLFHRIVIQRKDLAADEDRLDNSWFTSPHVRIAKGGTR